MLIRMFILSALISPSLLAGEYYPLGKTLVLTEIEQKWGSKPFSAELFMFLVAGVRKSMAYDIVKGQRFRGKTISEVERELGPANGFFSLSEIPAYVLEEGWTSGRPTWQLVFLPGESKRIERVFVHEQGSDLKELADKSILERAQTHARTLFSRDQKRE